MGDVVLVLGLLTVAVLFVGAVFLVRRIGSRYPAQEREGDTMLRDGIVLSVVFPLLGIVWAARLLAKDRIGHGLAVLLISLTVSGLGWLLFLEKLLSPPSTTGSSAVSQVEDQITSDGYSDPSCFSVSKTEMSCTANDPSNAQLVMITVRIDPDSGAFTIQPQAVP